MNNRMLAGLVALALSFGIGACADPTGLDAFDAVTCSIPVNLIFDGGPGKDGIPALVNPDMVASDDPDVGYLRDRDRVIGIAWNGDAIAVPLNLGWWHEIVNLEVGGRKVAITHCPLTGSSLGFDRGAAGGAEFGVSGLLYQNNLIMYDRNDPESLWPQLARGARCGSRDGTALVMVPVIEMTWAGWKSLHPDTRVAVGFYSQTRYLDYPYGSYDQLANESLLYPVENLDRRRPLKERVLGVPDDNGGMAFAYGELGSLGTVAVVRHDGDGTGPYVVLWDGERQAAMAFEARTNGSDVTLEVQGDRIVDVETGSEWGVDGIARSGTLAGQSLEPLADAHVAFWFGWAAFNPEGTLWEAGGGE